MEPEAHAPRLRRMGRGAISRCGTEIMTTVVADSMPVGLKILQTNVCEHLKYYLPCMRWFESSRTDAGRNCRGEISRRGGGTQLG